MLIIGKRLYRKLKLAPNWRYTWIFVFALFFTFIMKSSLTHPFLDSDNRHYGQKFYKYIITHPTRKLLMVPLYTYLLFQTYEMLKLRMIRQTQPFFFVYVLCSSMILVLTPLFELRYFIIPWVLLALEINGLKPPLSDLNRASRGNQDTKSLILNLGYFATINAIVIYVFVEKPFLNEYFGGELSRFFW